MLAAPQNSNKKSYNCFLCQRMKYFWWTLFQSRNRSRVKIFIFWKAWISFLFVAGLFCSWVCICLDKMVTSCTACTSVLLLAVLPSSLSLLAIILLLISSTEECFARTTLKQFTVHFCYLMDTTPPVQCKEVEGEEEEGICRKTKGSHNFECICDTKSKNLQSKLL